MYLDEKTQKMVFNLSKVIADQQSEIEDLKSSRDAYKRWYNDSQKREEILEKKISELESTIVIEPTTLKD